MPAKTNTERITDLEARTVLNTSEIESLEERYHRETSFLREDLRQALRDLSAANARIAALENGYVSLEKRAFDSDQRRWQLILAIFTCLFTGFVALIIALVKK